MVGTIIVEDSDDGGDGGDVECVEDDDCLENEECDNGICVHECYGNDTACCIIDCPDFNLYDDDDSDLSYSEVCGIVAGWDECLSDCDAQEDDGFYEEYDSCVECLANETCDDWSPETLCDGTEESNFEDWYCCSCNCSDFDDAECTASEYDAGTCSLDCEDDDGGDDDGPPECVLDCVGWETVELCDEFDGDDSSDECMVNACNEIVNWTDCWSDCDPETLCEVPIELLAPACESCLNDGTCNDGGIDSYLCDMGDAWASDCGIDDFCEDDDSAEECTANVCLSLSNGMLDYTSDSDIAGFQFNHNGCVTSAGGGDAEANGFTVSSSATAVLGFSFTGSVVPSGMGTLVELGGDVSFDCLSNYVFSDSAGGALSFEIISDDNADDGGDDGSDDGGNTETASVQVIHNSASPTVDVYIDGVLAVEDFVYRTATPVLELGTSFTVGIAPAGEAVIAEFPFDLMDGGEYVVVATGLLGNTDTPFDLVATSTTFGATEGNVGLNVYHGSTDAPAVDVLADGAVLVPNLSYGSFSGYVEVPAADYVVGVAPTGGASIADFVAPLSGLGGNSAVVFASGFLSGNDPAFGLFAALADGTVLELPLDENLSNSEVIVDSFDLLGNYPNPFNPSTTIDFSLNSFSDLEINVYDVNGRLVENLYSGFKSPGTHKVVWDATGFSAGIYIVNMVSKKSSETLMITLIK